MLTRIRNYFVSLLTTSFIENSDGLFVISSLLLQRTAGQAQNMSIVAALAVELQRVQ